jgi:hypothetical protein
MLGSGRGDNSPNVMTSSLGYIILKELLRGAVETPYLDGPFLKGMFPNRFAPIEADPRTVSPDAFGKFRVDFEQFY